MRLHKRHNAAGHLTSRRTRRVLLVLLSTFCSIKELWITQEIIIDIISSLFCAGVSRRDLKCSLEYNNFILSNPNTSCSNCVL